MNPTFALMLILVHIPLIQPYACGSSSACTYCSSYAYASNSYFGAQCTYLEGASGDVCTYRPLYYNTMACPEPCSASPGSYCNGPFLSDVLPCPAGSYCATTNSQPVACPANKYCLAGTSTPLSCSAKCGAGFYLTKNCSSTSDISCSPCPAGFMCPYGDPIPCIVNHYCPVGSSAQVPCPAGSYCDEGSIAPTTCTAGSYCPAAVANMPFPVKIPIACAYNQYCPPGSVFPGSCPTNGSYCPTPAVALPCPPGATCLANRPNAATFTLCQAGYKCAGGDALPVPCPAGTFSSYGNTQCTPCSNGTYTAVTASPICTMCPQRLISSPINAKSASQCSCVQGSFQI